VAGFVNGDRRRCRDAIISELEPICDRPFRRAKGNVWYRRKLGDWSLTTCVDIRGRSGIRDKDIDCYHFLRREDFPQIELRYLCCEPGRIDPLCLLGITRSTFWMVSERHEQICARAVRDVV